MKKNAEKQQDSHQEPQRWTKVHKLHKDKDREKPRQKKKKGHQDKGVDHRDKLRT